MAQTLHCTCWDTVKKNNGAAQKMKLMSWPSDKFLTQNPHTMGGREIILITVDVKKTTGAIRSGAITVSLNFTFKEF